MKKEDLRILKTKASLYRTLIELMKEKEFEQIKISEICSKSMINRSTFYDHFNDKYELLESFMNDLKKELEESIKIDIETNSIKEYYMEILKATLDYIDKNKEVYSSMLKINSNSIAKDMMIETVLNSITSKINSNFENKSKIPTKNIVLFYVSGTISVLINSLCDINTFNKEEVYNTITELIPEIKFIVSNK